MTRIFREILVDIAQYAYEKSSTKRALTTASLQALTRQSIFFGGGLSCHRGTLGVQDYGNCHHRRKWE